MSTHFKRRRSTAPAKQTSTVAATATDAAVVPYDEHLLERARTQWQFGDWESLIEIDRNTLQHHPDRAKLALLAAAGHLQTGNQNEAMQYIRLAKDWGCSNKLLLQILAAGVHNSLGRAAAISNQQGRALQHFENAITIGTPGSDAKLLTQARTGEQLGQLGLPTAEGYLKVGAGEMAPMPARLPPLSQRIETLTDILKQQKTELDTQLKKHADELIYVRKSLDSAVKKEISNATKQIEGSIGLQNYFATGDLPNVNTERHAWPVSPDFALYLIELIEFNDYDLIIEFGSGISTVIVAKTIVNMTKRRQGKPPADFISFDHLDQYYQQTLAKLKHEGLDAAVQLHYAPLHDYTASNGKVYPYYACLGILAEADQRHAVGGLRVLVIVDGPPGRTGPNARYPAGPIIFSLFKGAQIDLLLDDYIRDDEKEIVKLWQAELKAARQSFTISERKLEKDACLIAVGKSKDTP